MLSYNVVTVLVNTMVHEPTQLLPTEEILYVHDLPNCPFSHYIKDFFFSDKEFKKDCTLLSCPGPKVNNSHIFIEEKDCNIYNICQNIYCKLYLPSKQNTIRLIYSCTNGTNSKNNSIIDNSIM